MTTFIRLRSGRLVEAPPAVLSLPRPQLDTWLETEKGIPIPDEPVQAPPRPFTDEQLDKWIVENAKLEPEGIASMWCKHCKRFVLAAGHKVVSRTPLWKILLWLDGHSLPDKGTKRRELSQQYKEAAKRLEYQSNIQTRLFIWDTRGNEALRIVRWDGHKSKWVVEKKKKEPPKVVVVERVVKKKAVKKVAKRKRRRRCQAPDCTNLFMPIVSQQKYCSRPCRERAQKQRYLAKKIR